MAIFKKAATAETGKIEVDAMKATTAAECVTNKKAEEEDDRPSLHIPLSNLLRLLDKGGIGYDLKEIDTEEEARSLVASKGDSYVDATVPIRFLIENKEARDGEKYVHQMRLLTEEEKARSV